MKKFIAAFAIALVSSVAFGQDALVGEWPAGGGPITVTTTGEPIVAGGLDIKATGPYLSNGSDPAPWAFYITGNDGAGKTQVTLGSLGSAPTLDGSLTLDVSVSGEAASSDDVTATWGDGTTPVAFPVTVVPEPATGLMAAFGLIGLLGLRRRR